jgi:outer membrane protein assembly factor BamE (lipoprotein component of BamABCDE complex)
MTTRITAALAALALAGCANTEFVRMERENLVLGKTTYADVVAKMGAPKRESAVLKNGAKLHSATYLYAPPVGKPVRANLVPARAQSLYFHDGRLVAHEFVSSWAEDSTDFDTSRLGEIVRGKTTREEVYRLLGEPSGFAVYPMIRALKGEAAIYLFAYETNTGVMNLKSHRKALVVTFDEHGVVTEVDYTFTRG